MKKAACYHGGVIPDLFKGTASYYARYRPGYPEQLFKHLVRTFKLDGTGRLLDLGCGTGQLAIPLAPYFNQVIAMDPDQAMLREGRRAAKKAITKNISWVLGSSEMLGPKTGFFRLVVMGRSFHWMNQKRTLATLYKLVERGGGIVIVSEGRGYGRMMRRSTGWRAVLDETVKEYLGSERRAGRGFYQPPRERFQDLIRESPFRTFKTYRHRVRFVWDLRGVVGFCFSRSMSAKRLFGKHAKAFERDLRLALRAANHSSIFVDNTRLEALIAMRT